MSFTEQSGTPRESLAPVIPESSVGICLSGKSQLKSSPLVEEAGRENYSMGETSSNSDSGSGSESSATTDSQLESLAEPEILRRNCPACHFRKTHLWLRRLMLIWSWLLLVSQRLIYPCGQTKQQMNQPRMNLRTNNRYVKRKFWDPWETFYTSRYILHGIVMRIQI